MNERAKRQREENYSCTLGTRGIQINWLRTDDKIQPFRYICGFNYTELHKFTEVSCITEITGTVFPQLPNFQGHIPTCLRHSNLTAWEKKKSTSFCFGAVQHRLCARIPLCVCLCIHLFRMRRVSFNLTKRRRRGKRRAMPRTHA